MIVSSYYLGLLPGCKERNQAMSEEQPSVSPAKNTSCPQGRVYPADFYRNRHGLDRARWQQMQQQAVENPEAFWQAQAQRLQWDKPFDTVRDCHYGQRDVRIRWFADGRLNACTNCVDRHLPQRANDTALIWQGDDPQQQRHITFQELHDEVCRFANVLKQLGVQADDRVTLYLPMIPEAVFAMLACARIGAVHSVVFAGFSAQALADRIDDCESRLVITADEGRRGGKRIPLKDTVDKALELACTRVDNVLVVPYTGTGIHWQKGRDQNYAMLREDVPPECEAVSRGAEDPLFILYTSGSTGKPKGIVHSTGGYLTYASLTHELVFDALPGDVYWCTADVGWITGHSYLVYGPLANGITTLVYEGVPNYPDAGRIWREVDKHGVNILYTAPTAIRALMAAGDEPVKSTSRKTLRVLGTVGEPINPQAWEWYFHVVGEGRCPIVDTWWQTETGGIMLSPIPGIHDLKPGAALAPFPGIVPQLVDEHGDIITGRNVSGLLTIAQCWPGQARDIQGNHKRFLETYFKAFPGRYFTGDGACRDADGDWWITGRVDDVINVSGHRLGTAEVESALVSHPQVAEAAVIGIPHPVKGEGIYAFVTLKHGAEKTTELLQALMQRVREHIGAFARPEVIQWAPALPKTRSGKIMRRILRKIAVGDYEDLGDTSTLADPEVVEKLLSEARQLASADHSDNHTGSNQNEGDSSHENS
jgi:acetyl-CoA synthetase